MFGELWQRTNFTGFFHPPHPFANTCNQKQGTPQSPNQETRNAQQEKMMIVMIINGMKDDKKLKIKCKILWRQAQVGITWAQADCNFQNLAGKKNICLKSRGSKNETHSYNAPVCSLIVLPEEKWYCGLLRLLAAGAQISKQTFFRIQYFSATTCQNKMNIMNISWWKMPETCSARRRYTLKTTQKSFGNFPIPRLQQTLQKQNLQD